MSAALVQHSAQLRAFLAASPLDRPHIGAFVTAAAQAIPSGSRVLDAGAGIAPYRELFSELDYVTADWANSMHAGADPLDVVAPIDDLPFEDASFDAVVSTQVLEHLADPRAALQELHRVLRPGGRIWVSAPLVWELHEEPYDFFRYTPHGLRVMLEAAGFEHVEVRPFGGYFSTVGHMLRNAGSITGLGGPGRPVLTRLLAAALARVGPLLRHLDRFDRRHAIALVHGASAIRPRETA